MSFSVIRMLPLPLDTRAVTASASGDDGVDHIVDVLGVVADVFVADAFGTDGVDVICERSSSGAISAGMRSTERR